MRAPDGIEIAGRFPASEEWPFGAEAIVGDWPGIGRVVTVTSAPAPDGIERMGADGEQVREGITRRRVFAATGTCPCGATLAMTRQQRRAQQRAAAKGQGVVLGSAPVEHEDDCPGIDPFDGIAVVFEP